MSASKSDTAGDLLKFITYDNTAADYEELPEITEEQFAVARGQRGGKPARGRPPLGTAPKQQVTLRLDPKIQARFRSSGPGWQGRMNTFLAHNEVVLTMIVEFDDCIGDMETLVELLRTGGIRTMSEPVEASIAKVERNISLTKDNVRNLRETLVWEPAEAVD